MTAVSAAVDASWWARQMREAIERRLRPTTPTTPAEAETAIELGIPQKLFAQPRDEQGVFALAAPVVRVWQVALAARVLAERAALLVILSHVRPAGRPLQYGTTSGGWARWRRGSQGAQGTCRLCPRAVPCSDAPGERGLFMPQMSEFRPFRVAAGFRYRVHERE
ncbi:hypothetical protein [Streptomyces hygroscopicus]|uniref:hypothetical protein n=1 Tax=Streptomyces hygroscopicus TaxID=1912 RepID=UPI00131D1670|nr:hypothetical protein [Streptomyces hygroscopicus]